LKSSEGSNVANCLYWLVNSLTVQRRLTDKFLKYNVLVCITSISQLIVIFMFLPSVRFATSNNYY